MKMEIDLLKFGILFSCNMNKLLRIKDKSSKTFCRYWNGFRKNSISLLQGTHDNYETDHFKKLIESTSDIVKKSQIKKIFQVSSYCRPSKS